MQLVSGGCSRPGAVWERMVLDLAAHEGMITLVEKQKNHRSRYNIYINDEYAFSVHEDVLVKHRLMRGAVIDEEHMQVILADEEHNQAMQKALRYIGTRPRSIKEVEYKLSELEYDEEIIANVLAELQAKNYLNDREYAVRLTQYRLHTQKKGLRWIAHELREKGVRSEYIEEAIAAVKDSAEWQAAIDLAAKRLRRTEKPSPKDLQKVGAYLMRRGFEPSVVMRVIHHFSE